MEDLRSVYLREALSAIPRVLSLLDRNPLSPTYGCFDRGYWLDKTGDFPDAMTQFAVQALALAYTIDDPSNPYYRQPKIRDWTIAGLEYWAGSLHRDGSCDEFYPYERGWAGPTGFMLYASVEAYRCLADEMPPAAAERILDALRRAASFVAGGEAEEDHLANHHALAWLAVRKAADLLDDPVLEQAATRLRAGFLRYCRPNEGWSVEYDGVDPGYLSATVSFLAKLYLDHPAPEILELARGAIGFASYFVYPDGHYGGSLGSRQTLHFYPHGAEVFAREIPLAATLAQRMLEGLVGGALVPPRVMPDRYLPWRVAEFLLAYVDAQPRPSILPPLPWEQEPFQRWYPEARVYARRDVGSYLVANLARGGVLKVFDTERRRLAYNDAGLLGRLANGQLVTTQWIDPTYTVTVSETALTVQGAFHLVTSAKRFTPLKMAAFRVLLATLGQSPRASHLIKGGIRKVLMLGSRSVPLRFRREIMFEGQEIQVVDTLRQSGRARLVDLLVGDEFGVRFVPQSRYFQPQEFQSSGYRLSADELAGLEARSELRIERRVQVPTGLVNVRVGDRPWRTLGSSPATAPVAVEV